LRHWLLSIGFALSFVVVRTAVVARDQGSGQRSAAQTSSPFGIMVFRWLDGDCSRMFDQTEDIGAVVLTREARDEKAHAAPKGWAFCDGALLKASDFPQALKVLKRKFSLPGDPPDSFRLPNLNGLFVYDTSLPDRIQLFSKLSCQDGVQEAAD